MIANSALQEDVDVICVSILSGAHNQVFPEVLRLLKEKGAGDIPVVGGGIIPDKDIESLKKLGVKEIFTPGSALSEITRFISSLVQT
jgi:methylmalonyl-CoA mutase C-terminal domain/subunit